MKRETKSDVVLVSMPFGFLLCPSIGITLLKEVLRQHAISVQALYFTFDFARLTGVDVYQTFSLCQKFARPFNIVGEWIFADALCRQTKSEVRSFVQNVLKQQDPDNPYSVPVPDRFIDMVMATREKANGFLENCLRRLERRRPRIVGFSSVFHQNVASLALARRIKERWPDIFVVFGGANCHGIMGRELASSFPFVDAVVSGEGDVVFPQLVKSVLAGNGMPDLPGVFSGKTAFAAGNGTRRNDAAPVPNLNDLPSLDYDDFFAQFHASGISRQHTPRLVFETSRGCWWGEKQHCRFCGSDFSNQPYRSKSPNRALTELNDLRTRYPGYDVFVVDNTLDMRYFKNFLPTLAGLGPQGNLFYELKPFFTREQARVLRRAGVSEAQIGIETLSTLILRIMNKGNTALQNLKALKFCGEFGIKPFWNVLWGVPGESPIEYARMAELIPAITHLCPPMAMGPVTLERFSPFFADARRFGITNVRPFPAYKHVYPLTPESIRNMAYYFQFDRADKLLEGVEYVRPLVRSVIAWLNEHEESHLLSFDMGAVLYIWDTRACAARSVTALTGMEKAVCLACESGAGIAALQRVVERFRPSGEALPELNRILTRLVEMKLVVRENDIYLNLAVPVGAFVPDRQTLKKAITCIRGREEIRRLETLRSLARINDQPAGLKVSRAEIKAACICLGSTVQRFNGSRFT